MFANMEVQSLFDHCIYYSQTMTDDYEQTIEERKSFKMITCLFVLDDTRQVLLFKYSLLREENFNQYVDIRTFRYH